MSIESECFYDTKSKHDSHTDSIVESEVLVRKSLEQVNGIFFVVVIWPDHVDGPEGSVSREFLNEIQRRLVAQSFFVKQTTMSFGGR